METDGHAPAARQVPALGPLTVVGCECGMNPRRAALLASALTAWHAMHRSGLRLPPADYTRLDGIGGRWARTAGEGSSPLDSSQG